MAKTERPFGAWQESAISSLEAHPTDAAWNVLRRTLETATDDVVMERMPAGESRDPRVELYPMHEDEGRMEKNAPLAKVILNTRGLLMRPVIALCQMLDENFGPYAGAQPSFLKDDYRDAREFVWNLRRLGVLFHDEGGDDLLDLSTGFLMRAADEDRGKIPGFVRIAHLLESFKQGMMAVSKSFRPNEKESRSAFGLLLGQEWSEELGAEKGGEKAMMKNLLPMLRVQKGIRQKLDRNLQSVILQPQKLLASAFIRQGWRRTMQHKDLMGEMEKQYKGNYHSLWAKIASEPHPSIVAAKERALLLQVYAEVIKYGWGKDDQKPSYELGFPRSILEGKEASCFGKTWLAAMALLSAGVPYRDILYCHVNKTESGLIGSHAALLVRTALSDLVILDPAWNIVDRNFPFLVGEEPEVTRRMAHISALLHGRREDPCLIRFPAKVADEYGVHCDVQILPLNEGLASGHLLHVGLSFFHEKKPEEARHAWELALTFNPKDPDVLYYLGLLSFQQGDHAEAQARLKEATTVFKDHLQSHYALGELALARGNVAEALRKFRKVADTKGKIWGDDEFRAKARKALGLSGEDLLKAWQTGEMKNG